jgi:pyridoxal phosphate enzyme (YggS family)
MNISSKIASLRDKLPSDVKLIAVSKSHSVEAIMEAYKTGLRLFGENRTQELIAKQKILPNDIEWHFIGSLQKNKVKNIAPFVHTIHSVDSLKLLQEIDKQAGKQSRIIQVLLEIHIAREESKHGFIPEECTNMLEKDDMTAYPNIHICGLMGMATFTDDKEQVRKEYHTLCTLFQKFKSSFFANCNYFTELSMGMTNDYEIAVSEGSTMVRIGRYIFDERG